MLEHLANSNAHKVVLKRVKFLHNKNEYLNIQLLALKEYRNRYAHTGKIDDRTETYIYLLKRYVEKLLIYHIENVNKFRSFNEACAFLDEPTNIDILNDKIIRLQKVKKHISSLDL